MWKNHRARCTIAVNQYAGRLWLSPFDDISWKKLSLGQLFYLVCLEFMLFGIQPWFTLSVSCVVESADQTGICRARGNHIPRVVRLSWTNMPVKWTAFRITPVLICPCWEKRMNILWHFICSGKTVVIMNLSLQVLFLHNSKIPVISRYIIRPTISQSFPGRMVWSMAWYGKRHAWLNGMDKVNAIVASRSPVINRVATLTASWLSSLMNSWPNCGNEKCW